MDTIVFRYLFSRFFSNKFLSLHNVNTHTHTLKYEDDDDNEEEEEEI